MYKILSILLSTTLLSSVVYADSELNYAAGRASFDLSDTGATNYLQAGYDYEFGKVFTGGMSLTHYATEQMGRTISYYVPEANVKAGINLGNFNTYGIISIGIAYDGRSSENRNRTIYEVDHTDVAKVDRWFDVRDPAIVMVSSIGVGVKYLFNNWQLGLEARLIKHKARGELLMSGITLGRKI